MGRPWYAHFPADYERKTSHLTMLEDGAYRRLLDHYYSTGMALLLDRAKLCRICRAFSEEEIAAIGRVLDEFFTEKRDGYHNHRADEEIAEAKRRIRIKVDAGKRGGIAARGKSGRKPNSKTIAPAIADELRKNTPSHPPPHPKKQEFKKSFSSGHGLGNGAVTIENPHERIARFQQKIAQALGPAGWETVLAACARSDPKHEASLALCKQTARSMNKGWPRQWPISP